MKNDVFAVLSERRFDEKFSREFFIKTPFSSCHLSFMMVRKRLFDRVTPLFCVKNRTFWLFRPWFFRSKLFLSSLE